MRRCRTGLGLAVVGAIALGSPSALSAQPRAGTFDEALSRLRRGEVVWVKDNAGKERRVVVDDLSGGRLTATRNGDREEIAAADVARLRVEERDPLWNGASIGALAALAYPLWFCSQSYESGETCAENIHGLGITAGLGAAIGAGIDALKKRRRTLYERPAGVRVHFSPTVSPRAASLAVSMKFSRGSASDRRAAPPR